MPENYKDLFEVAELRDLTALELSAHGGRVTEKLTGNIVADLAALSNGTSCGGKDGECHCDCMHQAGIDDADFAEFEDVLFQPETKKVQKVFLKDLSRPAFVYDIDLGAIGRDANLPIALRRPQKGEAIYIRFRTPAGRHHKIVIFELPATDETAAPSKDAGAPAVYISAEVAGDASIDMAYLHPLYLGDDTNDYLRRGKGVTCLYKGNVKKDGAFRWTSVNLGDSLVERGLIRLVEPHAAADLGGAAYVPADAEQLYQCNVRCLHPYSNVRIHNHGVVENEGNGTFISVSDIAKGARQTVAREDNRFITLGDRAKAFVDPTLLIDEYDVQASHAATVGQVDEETMYYLTSRGLRPEQANRLVTIGFLRPLLDRIPFPGLREELVNILKEKIHGANEAAGETAAKD